MHEKKTFFFCISLCSKHSKYSLWHEFKLLRAKWKGGSSRMKDKLYFCLLLLKSLFSVLFCNRTSGHRSSWHMGFKGCKCQFFFFLLCDLLQSDNRHRCSRSSITDIILPKFHLDVAFYYHGAMTFNSLPMNIKTLPPKERFPAISAFYS